MAQYFFGDDAYGAREAIQELAREQKALVQHVYSDEVTSEALGDLFDQRQGLFGAQLAVLHNPSQLNQAELQSLVDILDSERKDAVILWDQAKPDKRSKFWKRVKPIAQEFATPDFRELTAWLVQAAKQRGSEIEHEAAQELIRRVGTDRWRLSNELDKLLLTPGALTQARVRDEVTSQESAEIFPTLDALIAGDTALAIRNVELLLEAGENEFYVLSMLAYQFRTLLMIKTGLDEGASNADIARRGQIHPYVIQKNASLMKRLSKSALLAALTKIAATDFAIKQGKADARTALMMLMLGLESK